MNESSADQTMPVSLSCPECGSTLGGVPDDDTALCCPSHHRYTLPSLLIGQSRRVAALCETGAQLLEQQERLVRKIAEQLWQTQTLTAFRLEGRADRLRETTEALRAFIREDFLGGDDAAKGDELIN